MRIHEVCLSLACLSLVCLTPLATSAPADRSGSGSEELYRRSLAKAVARAQARLEATTEVWIDHSTWENAWQIGSDHYRVQTTLTRHFGEEIATGLETKDQVSRNVHEQQVAVRVPHGPLGELESRSEPLWLK